MVLVVFGLDECAPDVGLEVFSGAGLPKVAEEGAQASPTLPLVLRLGT